MNPADVYMDIISGSIVKPGQQEVRVVVCVLCEGWISVVKEPNASMLVRGAGSSAWLPLEMTRL